MRTQTVGWRRGAAAVAVLLAVAALAAVVLLATSAGGSNGSYTVRAIFDDAGNIIPGENVKIGGVKVGTVGSVTPTPQAKAAVVLNITDAGFKDFRADASCTIRPQALIGEKFVDCLPTQPRVAGTPLPPPLKKIGKGHEGAGQYLLPVQNTHSPVDVDLLGDISRLPERQRFTIILNELGAGLAGRGSDLHEVIQRANPALQELDKVLAILAGENKVLAKLAVDSDTALQPFAAVRNRVADFIQQSNTVAQASARHRGALARDLQLFPKFLKEFEPAMERLGRFADQTTPVFTDLKVAAPGLDKAFTSLPAFSSSSIKFFKNFGQTAKVFGPRADGRPAAARAPGRARQGSQAVRLQRFGTAHEPARHGRPGAPARLHLPRHRHDERIRRARPLPALGSRRHGLPHVRGHHCLAVLEWEIVQHRLSRIADERLDRARGCTQPRHERDDGAHAGGAGRRHAGAGARQIPRRDRSRPGRGGQVERHRSDAGRQAGRRRERGHDLLHAVGRRLWRRRNAPQLPARQLRQPR